MSTKSFTGAKKPGRRPTPEEIAAFEETGRAMARQRKITAKVERRESRNTQTREAVNTESRVPESAPSQEAVNEEMQNSAITESRESVSTENREPAITETPKAVPTVRLTIDLPESVHTRFKAACAVTRRKMVDEVRLMIEQRTADLETLVSSTQ
jgi:hypothetical protein